MDYSYYISDSPAEEQAVLAAARKCVERQQRRLGRELTTDEYVRLYKQALAPEPGPHDGNYWRFVMEAKQKGWIKHYADLP